MSYHQLLLALHILALTLGIGIAFSNAVNLRLAKTNSGDVAKGLGLQRAAMHKYTDAAFATILITGGLLLHAIGGPKGLNLWFNLKMLFVVVYVTSYVMARLTVVQIKKTGNVSLLGRVALFVHVALSGAVAALICAVLAFNG